jgi:hypothetical protein
VKPPSRLSVVAGVATLLGLVAVAHGAVILDGIPAEPRGDGFAAGLAAFFGLASAAIGVFAIIESVALAVSVRFDASSRVRRVLAAGCVVGGVAALLTVPFALASVVGFGSDIGPLLFRIADGVWVLWLPVTLVGVALSGVGLVLWLVELVRG